MEDYQNCSVLCCVRQSVNDRYTRQQFLKFFVCLGLILCLFGFSILCVFCFSLDYFVVALFAFVTL